MIGHHGIVLCEQKGLHAVHMLFTLKAFLLCIAVPPSASYTVRA